MVNGSSSKGSRRSSRGIRGSRWSAAPRMGPRRRRASRVLVLTMSSSPDHVCAAFNAGAAGYALKDQSSSEVAEAIRAVATGKKYLAPRLPRTLLEGNGNGTALERLSPREREIFDL